MPSAVTIFAISRVQARKFPTLRRESMKASRACASPFRKNISQKALTQTFNRLSKMQSRSLKNSAQRLTKFRFRIRNTACPSTTSSLHPKLHPICSVLTASVTDSAQKTSRISKTFTCVLVQKASAMKSSAAS